MEIGYIKVNRSFKKWEWYDDNNTKALFLHLLLSVNFTEGKWHGNPIAPGQIITSNSKLAMATGMTEQNIRTSLKKLEKTGEITTKSTNRFTLINVVKFTFYQSNETEGNKQLTDNKQTTNNQVTDEQQTINNQVTDEQQTINNQVTDEQQTTNNNIRSIKKEKKEKEEEEREEGEEGKGNKKNDYQLIADMYNSTCVSFPKCTKLSQARKDVLKARLKLYTIEDFKQVFEIAEKSDFLKGAGDRSWRANFDWMTSEKNMLKILEGCYINRTSSDASKTINSVGSNNPFFNMLKGDGEQ